MRLVRLILQGFKSFADRTEISFPDGITMIVGPNGCGKSNISDAVRWVLGEQNVRNLRGQRAEDIIFSGSASRKAKNGAEVTIVLDNAARELPLDTAEVSVTRRILRNGDSDFLINQRACRLKDIQELFANTGLGKGSLAIIGQNRVDQVLSARPEERRLIFEEVAGISRFRMRKEEGLSKLKRTADNMERVKDLIAVLTEQLGPMAEAAKKTGEYRKLAEKKRAAEVTEALLKLTSVRRMLARYENEARDLADERVRAAAVSARIDAEEAELSEAASRGEEAYRRAAEETAARQQETERLRGDRRVKEGELVHAGSDGERLSEEIDRGREEAEILYKEAEVLGEEREEAEAALAEEQRLLESAEETKHTAADALARAEEEYRRAQDEAAAARAERQRIEAACTRNEEERERLADAREASLSELENKKGEAAILSADAVRLAEEAAARESELSRLLEKGKAESAALKAGQEKSFEIESKRSAVQNELVAVRSRRAYLERADREQASFSNTTKTILSADEPWQDHVVGAFGELLRVPAEYTDAAEAALGGSISYIVTDTAEAAETIIGWMKRTNAGRTTFYPLDAMRPRFADDTERRAAGEPGICGIAADLIGCDSDIEDLKRAILGRILIAEDLPAARRIAQKYKYRLHIVTKDGQILRPGGSMTGGSLRKKENTFFGRKKEIAACFAKEKAAEKEMEMLRREREAQDEENARLSDAVGASRETYQRLLVEKAAAEGRSEGLLRAKTAAEAAIEAAEKALAELSAALSENEKERERLAEEKTALGEVPALPEETELAAARKAAAEASEAAVERRVALARAEENFRRYAEKEKEKAAAAKAAEAAVAAKTEEKDALARKAEQLASEIAALDAALQKKMDEAAEAARARDGVQDEKDRLAILRSEKEKERRTAQEALAEIERKLTERELRIEAQKGQEDEAETFLRLEGLTEAEAEALRIPGNAQDMAKKLASIGAAIDALGPVNPNAEAEYALEQERLASYEEQLEDFRKASDGLEKIIRGIDNEMEKQFAEAFAAINEEFGRMMRLMFRGGKGKLELTEPEHPLESGVELYLELPGKKRQPLTLMSGGERALTVIALLISFLAYRPAPFCFVDEIDAALDDANVERFSEMMAEYKKRAQFIVITHRKKTMEFADTLQGVTMGEKGVSSLVTVRVEDYIKEE